MTRAKPVFLFTDFTASGPYIGQLTAAVLAIAPAIPVVNLLHDAPSMRPDLAAYLLRACAQALPVGGIVVAVVDPGVGSSRMALIVETDTQTFVGPDNGLLSRVDGIVDVREIVWRPQDSSATFHGRDLFGPVAGRLAVGHQVAARALAPAQMVGADWSTERREIVYIDGYGNAMTGLRWDSCPKNSYLQIAGERLRFAETFSDVASGELFWTHNSQGLVEIAANGASAAVRLALAVGDRFLVD